MVSARFALLSTLASSAVASAGLAAREETSTTIETVYITITRTIHGYTGTPYTEYFPFSLFLDKSLCLSRLGM